MLAAAGAEKLSRHRAKPDKSTVMALNIKENNRVVVPTGFEPVAYGLGNRRSILLSYGTSPDKNRS